MPPRVASTPLSSLSGVSFHMPSKKACASYLLVSLLGLLSTIAVYNWKSPSSLDAAPGRDASLPHAIEFEEVLPAESALPTFEPIVWTGPSAVDVVISRYGESVSVLQSLLDEILAPNPEAHVIVYDKADDANALPPGALGPGVSIRRIPNVGMCDNTYLHHIVSLGERGELANFTFFVSGTAQKTTPPKAETLAAVLREAGPMGSLARNGGVFTQSPGHLWAAKDHPAICSDWFQVTTWTPGSGNLPDSGRRRPLVRASVRPLRAWVEAFLEPRGVLDKIGGLQLCSFWGIFGATRAALEQWPLGMWRRLLAEVSVHADVEAAHFMERVWYTILRREDLNPERAAAAATWAVPGQQ